MATSVIQTTKCSISDCNEETNAYPLSRMFKGNLFWSSNTASVISQGTLIEQIDRWEHDSIDKIKQRANQCRQLADYHTKNSIHKIEMHLNATNEQMNFDESVETKMRRI